MTQHTALRILALYSIIRFGSHCMGRADLKLG